MRVRALPTLLVAVAIALTGPVAARGAEPGLVLGGDHYRDAPVKETARAGARWARVFLFLPDFEPEEAGHYNDRLIEEYDSFFARMGRVEGVRIDVVVTGSPAWETGRAGLFNAPRDPAQYARALEFLARRFKQVDAWELWNEPDAVAWWKPTPDPVAYTELLRRTYPAIKRVNPAAKVVMGGLTGSNFRFLEGVYAAGGRGLFDVVAVHPDTACGINSPYSYQREAGGRISQYSFLGYREVRRSMLAAEDDKPIWMTEMGWSTSERLCDQGAWAGLKPGGVSEAAQARFLREAFNCIAEDPYVEVAFWFSLFDYHPEDRPDHRYGLQSHLGERRKPAMAAFEDVARRGDQLDEPCGDFAGPQIDVAEPASEARVAGPVAIRVAARDASGVTGVLVQADQAPEAVGQAFDPAAPSELGGAYTWTPPSLGPHTLKVTAADALGNTTTREVRIVAVPPAPIATTLATTVAADPDPMRRQVTLSVGPQPPGGLVRLAVEQRRRGRWRLVRTLVREARGPVILRLRFDPGHWRLRATYDGAPPFQPASGVRRTFRVSTAGTRP